MPPQKPSQSQIQRYVNFEVISREDIAFTHTVFVQCFFPLRHSRNDETIYQIKHGKTSLRLKAGELIDPNDPHKFEQRELPAGPKARLLLAYINDQAIRTRSPFIDMGESMRKFMGRNAISVGGKNGRELTREVKNLAAADIIIGTWEEDRARQDNVRIAESLSFWIEKDENQRTLWQPEMELSAKYFKVLQEHRVPTVFPVLVALQDNPRAMDVYVWLSYRLPRLKAPTEIKYRHLQPVFGHRLPLKVFKGEFRKALKQACKYYDKARIQLPSGKDYIKVYPSPSPVPERYRIVRAKPLIPRL